MAFKEVTMRIRTISLSAVFCLLLALPAAVGLSWAANIKVGIIDSQEIIKESKAAKAARTVLLEDLNDKKAVFSKKQEEVVALEEELKNSSSKMKEEKRKEKSEVLAREVKNLQRLKADLEEELNKKNVEFTQKILQEVMKIVQEYSKKEKFTFILEKKSLVTWDESIDITNDIIKIYDAKKK
jgi:outer membrane protein